MLRRAILAVAAVFSGMATYAQVNAEQVINIGRNVLSMDDYMLSIQYFNQAIKAKPYLSEPYFLRGLAKLYLEDYRGAEEDCTLAIERNKYKTESYKLRGFARQNMGLDSLAVTDYDEGLKYNPYDKYFLYYKAVAQTDMRRFEDSDTTFSKLLHLFPGFDDGYTARGRMHVLRGDTVAALADFDKAVSINGNSVAPRLMRADIHSRQNKWVEAVADMDEVLRLNPMTADYYVNRAFLRYNQDDYFGAMADYNYALQLEPYNAAAMFNRALLRYEVKDLDRAAADLEGVLRLEPANFHAKFNLGLIDLERGKNKEALDIFKGIATKYPRFYQVYYAMADAYRNLGDMKSAVRNAHYAEELVKRYVKDPDKNRLDRPAIAAGKSNSDGLERADESDEEVMERFNQLVTVSRTDQTELSYNEKIKGRVQDRNLQVEPEPAYALSFTPTPGSLQSTSNFFKELDNFNNNRYITDRIYLTAGATTPSDESSIAAIFSIADKYRKLTADGQGRPADWLGLGVAETMLKNYPGATEALDKAIAADGRFAVAYMARAFVNSRQNLHQAALADYDTALKLNPGLIYAWFNMGLIYCDLGDYTSAMECYSKALSLDPDFGPAYYNRGICYLQTGNKRLAFMDLAKGGELGVIPSYNLLKRMK